MAKAVDIGSAKPAKIRSPVAVAILTVVTLFVYLFFWWYFVNREMADYGRRRGTSELGNSPGKSLLAITLGALVIVPAVWTIVTTFKRVQALQRLTGETQPINGWIGLILAVVIEPALFGYMQSGLNGAWKVVAAGGALPQVPVDKEAEALARMSPLDSRSARGWIRAAREAGVLKQGDDVLAIVLLNKHSPALILLVLLGLLPFLVAMVAFQRSAYLLVTQSEVLVSRFGLRPGKPADGVLRLDRPARLALTEGPWGRRAFGVKVQLAPELSQFLGRDQVHVAGDIAETAFGIASTPPAETQPAAETDNI